MEMQETSVPWLTAILMWICDLFWWRTSENIINDALRLNRVGLFIGNFVKWHFLCAYESLISACKSNGVMQKRSTSDNIINKWDMLNYDIRLSYVCPYYKKLYWLRKLYRIYANRICINSICFVHKYQCDKVQIIVSKVNLCNVR